LKCLLRSSYLVREPGPRFTLHGTEGSFLIWGNDPQEEALKAGSVPGSAGWGIDPESSRAMIHTGTGPQLQQGEIPLKAGNYMAFYDNLHACLRQGAPLEVTPEQGRDVVRIIEAAYESGREGKVVTLG
jgi:scyllo-inositol 2-dehydrogenase (NADP+)